MRRRTHSAFAAYPASAINNFGAVAFPASELDPDTFNSEDSILRGSGGPLTTIADDTGELQSFNDRVSLNNFGRVAFSAFDDGFTREALFAGRGGALFTEAIVRATPRP